jgi:hypothetical protein
LDIREVCTPFLNLNTVTLSDVKYSFDVDFLRDEAVKLEETDLMLAHKLMSIAYQARPNGSFIKEKYNEYKQRLNIVE